MVKNPPANAGDTGLILGLGRSPGEGNGNTLQYSCQEGYSPWGRKRVRHDLVTKQQVCPFMLNDWMYDYRMIE